MSFKKGSILIKEAFYDYDWFQLHKVYFIDIITNAPKSPNLQCFKRSILIEGNKDDLVM